MMEMDSCCQKIPVDNGFEKFSDRKTSVYRSFRKGLTIFCQGKGLCGVQGMSIQ